MADNCAPALADANTLQQASERPKCDPKFGGSRRVEQAGGGSGKRYVYGVRGIGWGMKNHQSKEKSTNKKAG